AVHAVAREDIAGGGAGAADGVVGGRGDGDAELVGAGGAAGGVGAQEVALQGIAAGGQQDAGTRGEVLDGQSLDGGIAAVGHEAVGRAGAAAVEDNQRRAGKARFGGGVEDDAGGVGEDRQLGKHVDGLHAGGGEVEVDGVLTGIGRGVIGIED